MISDNKPDGLFQFTFMQCPPNEGGISGRFGSWHGLLPKLLKKFQAQASAGAFVPGEKEQSNISFPSVMFWDYPLMVEAMKTR